MGHVEVAALSIAIILGIAVLNTAIDSGIKMFVEWMNDKYMEQEEV